MSVTLRVVADQLVSRTDPDFAEASGQLLSALIDIAPRGCDVVAIVPSGEQHLKSQHPGLREVQALALARRELAASWQLGIAGTVGGGLIHSPTTLAPLVRHDRANRGDQTVITLWDLDAWEAPASLPKATVVWTRAMLRRAAKHADAVVVPSFAMAEKLAAIHNFGERIRVIAGAAPAQFAVPNDSSARLRDLNLPAHFALVPLDRSTPADISRALSAAVGAVSDDRDVVIVGAQEGQEPQIVDLAAAAGIPERHVQVRSTLDQADRAAVLSRADVAIFASEKSAWPWRLMEALALGVPIVAADTPVYREVISDGGIIAEAKSLAEAAAQAVGDEAERLQVLSGDRGRSYSWLSAAEKVWQLHAEL